MADPSTMPIVAHDGAHHRARPDAKSRTSAQVDMAPSDIVAALAGTNVVHFGGFGQVPKQPRWIRPGVTFVAAALAPVDAIAHIARSKSVVNSLTTMRAIALLIAAFSCGIVFSLLVFWGMR